MVMIMSTNSPTQIAKRLISRSCWRKARCTFILSTGRVGTKTIINLANLAEQVEADHEPLPRRRTLARQAYHDIHQRSDFYRRHFIDARADRLAWARLRGRVYVEATNMISFAPMIAREMPRARFIHLHRHPGDVVRSGMRRGWFGPHPWDRYRIEPVGNDPAHAQWASWDAFHKICWVWQAVNRFLLDFTDSVTADRVLTLGFNDMVNPTSDVQERLFSFIGVRRPADEAIRQVLSVRDNAQEHGDFPKYHAWSDQQRLILRDIAGPVMERLGYDEPMGDGYAHAA